MAWSTKIIPNDGWNSGARTIAYLMADGLVEFEVGQAVGIVCGLNDVDNDAGYREIDHAFLIESGRATVIEGGVKKGGYTSYAPGATFSISRSDNEVRYYVAGSLLYTSLIPSTGAVFVDCSLYAANDTVIDVRFTDYLSGGVSFSALSAFGTDQAGDYGLIVLSGLTTANDDVPDPIALSPLAVLGSDGDFGHIDLSPLTVLNDDLIPESDYGALEFLPLALLEAADVVEEGLIELAPMDCFGADTDGIGFAEFEPLTIDAEISIDIGFLIELPFFGGYSAYHDALLTIPAPFLTAEATNHTCIAALQLPSPILTTRIGAQADLSLPAPVLAATGTVQRLARAALELPAPVLTATGKTGDTASAAITIPAPLLTTRCGATASLELLAPQLAATGRVQAIATATLELPAIQITATGTTYGRATATLEIPVPLLYAGNGNRAALEIPAPFLTATATTASTAETTYAINLSTGAVTQLLLGGFDKLVTAHGRLYGLKAGALTRLEGDVDGTVTTIPATIRFAPQTFGTNAVKRMSDVYWSSREADGMTMELVADERTLWRYQTPTDTAPAFGTHKIKTGRGVTFHTAGLTVRNRSGGALDIGGVELLVSPLSRKPL